MAVMMAELQASAQYEGLWSCLDSQGTHHVPHTVAELQQALSR